MALKCNAVQEPNQVSGARQELEEVGGGEELDRMVQEHDLLSAKRR